MSKFKLMLVALAAGVFVAGQVGVAKASDCGGGTVSPGLLTGNYTLSFQGINDAANSPFAGSGSIHLDGKGNVIAGIINCNFSGTEYHSTISGGCYSINSDGTGFMEIATTEDVVCGKAADVNLQLAIVSGGRQFQFSSDADTTTGTNRPFSGTANSWQQP